VLLALGSIRVFSGQSLPKHGGVLEPPISREVRCVLHVESVSWKREGPALIDVRLESLVDRDLDLRIIPTFYLANAIGNYWSPTDIVQNSALEIRKGPRSGGESIEPVPLQLHLNKQSSSVFHVDAAKTKWAQVISSTWPSFALRALPSGPYSLRLEFSVGGELVKSNEVKVSIEK
jgi:hypothetical protein